jgi:hypothetical protein
MTRKGKIVAAAVFLACLLAILVWQVTSSETARLAREAYIYGYPLVTFDMVRKQQTNVSKPDAERAPMGQLVRMRNYPPVERRATAVNADTLYTLVWLDVFTEPWIFSIPDMGDRYYIMPMHDGFSEVFMAAGALLTGGKPQTYAITGPGWSGTLPECVEQVKAPTPMVWICGRIYCTGTPEDYAAVHALQDQFSVVPLSAYGKPYTPQSGTVDPSLDMKTSVRMQVNSMDIESYFYYLAKLLKANAPKPEDAPIVEHMARIGLVPGQDFDPSKLGILGRAVIKAVPKLALLEMGMRLKKQPTTNGWLYFTSGVGNFGTDYVLRAMANLAVPGWNRPQDAIYPLSQKDANGDAYDGAKYKYAMRFEKGKMPPVDGFWSLTMYDADFIFVANPINRYTLSQRDALITNLDGSIDLYIQAESPGKDKEANWLPAPKGVFNLMMRLYGPPKTPPSILDGSWTPPPVKRTQ